VDLRRQPRVAAQYRVVVRHAGSEASGTTENLSERGAMVSVITTPPMWPSDVVEIDIELPGIGLITHAATVRWVSSVLPGMTGIELNGPILPEFLAHVARLLEGLG
jgi:hypothetical protein